MNSSPAIAFHQLYSATQESVGRVYFEVCARGSKIARLPVAAQRMVELFRAQHTLSEVCQQIGLSLDKGLTVTGKLVSMGILRGRGLNAPFTSQEEEFFAAEVPPIDECEEPFSTWLQRLKRFIRRTKE